MTKNSFSQRVRKNMQAGTASEREVILMGAVLELQHRIRALEEAAGEAAALQQELKQSVDLGYEIMQASVMRLFQGLGVAEEEVRRVFEEEEDRVLGPGSPLGDQEAAEEEGGPPDEADAVWEVIPEGDPSPADLLPDLDNLPPDDGDAP